MVKQVRVRAGIRGLGRLMELRERQAEPLYKSGARIHWKQASMAQLVDGLACDVNALLSLTPDASADTLMNVVADVCNAAFHLGTRQAICTLDDIGGVGADTDVDN